LDAHKSKKVKGGFRGAQQDGKEEIRQKAEFALCAPRWFFPSFFAIKKGGRGALDST